MAMIKDLVCGVDVDADAINTHVGSTRSGVPE